MAIRWILCPVITVVVMAPNEETGALEPTGTTFRALKFTQYTDSATGRRYPYSAAVATADWGLAFVRGMDWAPIAADGECINVLERDYETSDNLLAATPRSDGWTNARVTSLRNRLAARGVDTTGLTRDSTFRDWLNRLGRAVDPNFDAAQVYVV